MPDLPGRSAARGAGVGAGALVIAVLSAATGCAHGPAGAARHGPARPVVADAVATAGTAVGVVQRAFEDPGRSNWMQSGPRPLRTILWYPAAAGGVAETHDVNGRAQAFARNAPLSGATAGHPLVLVSHGAGSRAAHMAWLGHALAARGYIVAAVDHNGSAEEELRSASTPSDYFAWERARDLTVVLDLLLADPAFGPAIDRDRIGAAGFSLGGTTVLWLGGARLDLDHLRRNAPPAPAAIADAIGRLRQLPDTNEAARRAQARAEGSYRDARIRGVFALAPAMGFGFSEAGLRGVGVPVQIVVGEVDRITPAAANARHFADHIPGARYLELPGERGHFTALTPADARTRAMDEVAGLALAFFEATLD